jgi:hypothetical protein
MARSRESISSPAMRKPQRSIGTLLDAMLTLSTDAQGNLVIDGGEYGVAETAAPPRKPQRSIGTLLDAMLTLSTDAQANLVIEEANMVSPRPRHLPRRQRHLSEPRASLRAREYRSRLGSHKIGPIIDGHRVNLLNRFTDAWPRTRTVRASRKRVGPPFATITTIKATSADYRVFIVFS